MSNLEIDIKDLRNKIDTLRTKELYKFEKTSLRKAASILLDKTKTNLLAKVPKATVKNPKYSDTLFDAAKMTIKQDATNNYYFTVHIMGSRKKDSGTFRTRFFEGGTVPRKTDKGYNRGSLKATNFFGSAISSTENRVVNSIQEEFIKQINDYWNGK